MTELGNRLREAREAKGLSLEDLQNITKIQKRYLIGIEEGNYAPMPGDFYVRAFIKQYCEAVDLAPEQIFHEYASEIPATHKEDLPEKLSRVSKRKTLPQSGSRIFEIIPKIVVSLFIIAVIFAVWYIIQKNAADNSNVDPIDPDDNQSDYDEAVGIDDNDPAEDDDTTDEDTDDPPVDDQEPKETEPTLENVDVSGDTATYRLSNAKTFKLDISSSGETWIEVDGQDGTSLYFAKITDDDGVKTFDVTSNAPVRIRVGRPNETAITVNDHPLEFVIDPDLPQTIIIEFEPTNT